MIDAVGPDEVMEFLEIERERGTEFERCGLGHQHRFPLERRCQFDDEPFSGVVGRTQECERVRRVGQGDRIDDDALRVGPVLRNDPSRLHDDVSSEFVRSGAGRGDATRHVAVGPRRGSAKVVVEPSMPARDSMALIEASLDARSSIGNASEPDVGTSRRPPSCQH